METSRWNSRVLLVVRVEVEIKENQVQVLLASLRNKTMTTYSTDVPIDIIVKFIIKYLLISVI